jgi:hypothetical protein
MSMQDKSKDRKTLLACLLALGELHLRLGLVTANLDNKSRTPIRY